MVNPRNGGKARGCFFLAQSTLRDSSQATSDGKNCSSRQQSYIYSCRCGLWQNTLMMQYAGERNDVVWLPLTRGTAIWHTFCAIWKTPFAKSFPASIFTPPICFLSQPGYFCLQSTVGIALRHRTPKAYPDSGWCPCYYKRCDDGLFKQIGQELSFQVWPCHGRPLWTVERTFPAQDGRTDCRTHQGWSVL